MVVLFSLREDELAAEQEFRTEHPEIDLQTTREDLSKANMHLVTKGCEAVVVQQITSIEPEVYEHLHQQGVKVFATRSAGYDMYNTSLLKQYGIRLVNVPSYSPESIAQYAFSSALYFVRNLHLIHRSVQERDFRWHSPLLARRIENLTVGIIGTGYIGQQTAKLFQAVGAKVIAYDFKPTQSWLEYVSFEELLTCADIISLHIPATEETYHLLGSQEFSKMKTGAILVNTARGSIVDTKAMLEALDEKHIAGAALDVYEYETRYVNKDFRGEILEDALFKQLIERDDVLYSPHIAFYTHAAVKTLLTQAVLGAIDLVSTGSSEHEIRL